MPKLCSYKGCSFPIFGKGYCKIHQHLRTDKKNKSLRRTAIRKISKKMTDSLGERKLKFEKDKQFYLEIWEERNHVCYETNVRLGGEPSTSFFHHVLPKASEAYKKYRHCKWNIVLVSLETHSKTETNIDFSPRIKAYRNFLLQNLNEIENGRFIPEQEKIVI